MELLIILAMILIGYLFGSLMPSEWLVRWKTGLSLRDLGENPGAAAAMLRAGKLVGILSLLLDLLKAAVPVSISTRLGIHPDWMPAIVIAPVVGACWPFRRFNRGGRGFAAGAGALMPLAFWQTVCGMLMCLLPVPFLHKRHGLVMALIGFPVSLGLMIWSEAPVQAWWAVGGVMGVMAVRFLTGGYSRK
jgi:glycerol-3-phosphate acyltransferase PlsY